MNGPPYGFTAVMCVILTVIEVAMCGAPLVARTGWARSWWCSGSTSCATSWTSEMSVAEQITRLRKEIARLRKEDRKRRKKKRDAPPIRRPPTREELRNMKRAEAHERTKEPQRAQAQAKLARQRDRQQEVKRRSTAYERRQTMDRLSRAAGRRGRPVPDGPRGPHRADPDHPQHPHPDHPQHPMTRQGGQPAPSPTVTGRAPLSQLLRETAVFLLPVRSGGRVSTVPAPRTGANPPKPDRWPVVIVPGPDLRKHNFRGCLNMSHDLLQGYQ